MAIGKITSAAKKATSNAAGKSSEALTDRVLEQVQAAADLARTFMGEETSWGELGSSAAAVLSFFGVPGRIIGIGAIVAGTIADEYLESKAAAEELIRKQKEIQQAIERAEAQAKSQGTQASQQMGDELGRIQSELQTRNDALQAEVAAQTAELAHTGKGADLLGPVGAADPAVKARLEKERLDIQELEKRLEENQYLLARVRKLQEASPAPTGYALPGSDSSGELDTSAAKVERHSKALKEARECVDDYAGAVNAQVAALGKDTQARTEAEAAIEAQNAALTDGVKLVQAQKKGGGDLSEADAKRQAELKRFQADANRVAADLSGVLSNAVWNGLTGEGDMENVLDWFRNLFKQIATEALSSNIVLPIVKQTVEGLPGLFGISAPANQNGGAGQAAGGFVQQAGSSLLGGRIFGAGGFTGWLDNFGYSIGIGSPAVTMVPTASVQASQIAMLQKVNPGLDPAALAAGYEAPTATSGGALGLSSYLGAGVGGFAAGTMVGGMLGTQTGSKAVGGLSGAASGALAGFMLTGGNPIGAVVGGVAGGLGGLLGTQKPTVGPNYSVHFGPDGFQAALVDNGFSMDEARRNGEALAASVAAIAELTGGRNTSRFGIGWTKHGYEIHNFGGVAGRMGQFQDIGSTLRHALTRPGAIAGGDAETLRVLSRSRAKDAEGLIGDLQFAQGVVDLNRGLRQTEIAIREVAKGYDEQIRRAKELGLATDALREARAKEIAGLREAEQRTLAASEASLRIRELTLAGRDEEALRVRLEEQRAAELHSARQAVEAGSMTEKQYKRLVSVLNGEMAQALEAFEKQAGQSAAALRDTAAQTAATAIGGITQYVRSISIGDMSALAPERQFGLARSRFNAVSGAALAGDLGSLQQITGYADSLLRAARQQYGSGVGYAETFAQVTDVLSRLSAIDPERLTQRAFVTETRSQTQTLVTELQALRKEVEMLRREQQQGGNRPVRAA